MGNQLRTWKEVLLILGLSLAGLNCLYLMQPWTWPTTPNQARKSDHVNNKPFQYIHLYTFCIGCSSKCILHTIDTQVIINSYFNSRNHNILSLSLITSQMCPLLDSFNYKKNISISHLTTN